MRAPLAVLSLLVLASLAAGAAPVSFRDQVLPILEQRCAVCHRGESAQKGLRVTSVAALLEGGEGGPAIIADDPGQSLLMAKVAGAKPAMPPAGDKLTPAEVDVIRQWIASGAVDDRGDAASGDEVWWSLRPWDTVEPPAVDGDWAQTEIDRFVLARLQTQGLELSPAADRRTLIRRVTFDLLGLPPTPEQIEAFVRDPAPDAYEKLVDQLLANPAYGERWGRHWLDVARFGESNGYEQNHLRENAWPYRDWVIRSLNDDKPYNRMILEQLAGDRIAPGDPSIEAATGFLVAGPHDTVRIQNPEGEAQKRANHLDDMITATASGFLGLTVHCARCHDHKFDPIQQKDYYRLQSAFAGVWHDERTWAKAAEVAAYEQAAQPLQEELDSSKKGLADLRKAAQQRVEANRERILAGYRPSVDAAGTEEHFDPVEARFVRLTIHEPTRGRTVVDLDELEVWTAGAQSRNAALGGVAGATSMRMDEASPETYAAANLVDGKFDRRWISDQGMPQRVWVEWKAPVSVNRVKWSSDRLMGFGGRFGRSIPERYEIEVSLDGENWRTVADSDRRLPYAEEKQEELLLFAVFSDEEAKRWRRLDEQRDAAQRELDRVDQPREAFLGRFEQPEEPSFVNVRGNPMDLGDPVVPRSLSVLDGMLDGFALDATAPEGDRRLELAQWIASDDNVLTARVIVNRVWMHHFGQPFVRTPSDFGANGGRPTHPDLLEWLAQRLVRDHGWRLKPLHRDIVLSAAYRQSGTFREEAAAVDRDAAYLWRYPPRRLTAEEVRDTILSVSGKLDRTMGGPGFRLYRYTVDNVATYYPIEEFGPETFRRSVYHQHARSVKPELLGQFDCPDTALAAPKRSLTTTPLQALSLLNNNFVLEQARFLAERSKAEAGADAGARIERIWKLAFGRNPDSAEDAAAREFVASQGWDAFARAILNANELIYVF